jgi:hypothetical protein
VQIIGNEEPDCLEAFALPPAPAHDVPILCRTDNDIREFKVLGVDGNLSRQHDHLEIEDTTLGEDTYEVPEALFAHELVGRNVHQLLALVELYRLQCRNVGQYVLGSEAWTANEYGVLGVVEIREHLGLNGIEVSGAGCQNLLLQYSLDLGVLYGINWKRRSSQQLRYLLEWFRKKEVLEWNGLLGFTCNPLVRNDSNEVDGVHDFEERHCK